MGQKQTLANTPYYVRNRVMTRPRSDLECHLNAAGRSTPAPSVRRREQVGKSVQFPSRDFLAATT